MKKVAIIPFFKYEPVYQDNYLVLYKFFLLQLRKWIQYVDEVMIIDSGCGLASISLGFNNEGGKVRIHEVPARSHWQNMNEAIRQTNAEALLLLDSDMIITNPQVIKDGFDSIITDGFDVAAILDSSGSKPINDEKFAENEYRNERRRVCPYLCFIRKDALRPDFDFTPRNGDNWTDSMGVITEQLVEDKKLIRELQDDRATISLEDDGRITSVQWLDTAPKKWALKENPELGYYHIRNFGGALQVVNNYYTNKKEFYRLLDVMPHREILRLLAWMALMCIATKSYYFNIVEIVEEMTSMKKWNDYFEAFKKYHKEANDL